MTPLTPPVLSETPDMFRIDRLVAQDPMSVNSLLKPDGLFILSA